MCRDGTRRAIAQKQGCSGPGGLPDALDKARSQEYQATRRRIKEDIRPTAIEPGG